MCNHCTVRMWLLSYVDLHPGRFFAGFNVLEACKGNKEMKQEQIVHFTRLEPGSSVLVHKSWTALLLQVESSPLSSIKLL